MAASGVSELSSLLRDLVVANRVLARHDVLDAFGHVSIRHPDNPARYFMARSRSPELVSPDDLLEYELNGDPVAPAPGQQYVERAIHGAVYEARPDVMVVCHNHAEPLLPFGVTKAKLRPMTHVAGTMGYDIPVWDIAPQWGDTDLLVRTMEQGRSLAASLGPRRVALMRGHGCVVASASIPEVVMTCIYLHRDARLQLQAAVLGEVQYLTEGEAQASAAMMFSPVALERAWEYWASRSGIGEQHDRHGSSVRP